MLKRSWSSYRKKSEVVRSSQLLQYEQHNDAAIISCPLTTRTRKVCNMFVSNYRRAAAVSALLISVVLLAQIWSGSFIPFRLYFDDIQALSHHSNPDTESASSAADAQPSSAEKLGYVTWLGKTGDGSDKEDIYFIATRILVYQILHDPSTRSPRGLPIIVMTTPDVTAENRKRLEDDGATVIPIEFITE
ncbi:hypothetical protein LTS08_004456 [Lithohypha guttulata]|nr:hypothetical protein LTS08_004456 [Lithohypha guttulata]